MQVPTTALVLFSHSYKHHKPSDLNVRICRECATNARQQRGISLDLCTANGTAYEKVRHRLTERQRPASTFLSLQASENWGLSCSWQRPRAHGTSVSYWTVVCDDNTRCQCRRLIRRQQLQHEHRAGGGRASLHTGGAARRGRGRSTRGLDETETGRSTVDQCQSADDDQLCSVYFDDDNHRQQPITSR